MHEETQGCHCGFGGTGTAVGSQKLVLRVCAGAGYQCQGAGAATQRPSFQPGAISGIGSCSPTLWLSVSIPIPIIIPLGSWWGVQPLGMSLGSALCPMGMVPLQAVLKGPTSTISPHPWEWILGAATPWGHGQEMVALEQCLKGVAAQVAAGQSTAALEVPGAGQAGAEPLSRYGSCASTRDAIRVSWAGLCGSWAVLHGSWAAAGPQQC